MFKKELKKKQWQWYSVEIHNLLWYNLSKEILWGKESSYRSWIFKLSLKKKNVNPFATCNFFQKIYFVLNSNSEDEVLKLYYIFLIIFNVLKL